MASSRSPHVPQPANHAQKTNRLTSLKTGRGVTRQHFAIIPIIGEVITRVSQLGRQENQPDGIEILDGHKVAVKEEDTDSTEQEGDLENTEEQGDYRVGEIFSVEGKEEDMKGRMEVIEKKEAGRRRQEGKEKGQGVCHPSAG